MLQKPPSAPTLPSEDPKVRMEDAGRPCSLSGDQAQGVPGEAVTELKVVFNPKEIYSCGHLQNNGAHVIQRRRAGDTSYKVQRGRGRACHSPGFRSAARLLSLRLGGKFDCVRGTRSGTFILFCLKSYSFLSSLRDSSE